MASNKNKKEQLREKKEDLQKKVAKINKELKGKESHSDGDDTVMKGMNSD